MAREQITAPEHPRTKALARVEELRQRGNQRTPAQAAELIDLLATRVEDLERRLDEFAAGR